MVWSCIYHSQMLPTLIENVNYHSKIITRKKMQCHCKELPRPVELMILSLKLQL